MWSTRTDRRGHIAPATTARTRLRAMEFSAPRIASAGTCVTQQPAFVPLANPGRVFRIKIAWPSAKHLPHRARQTPFLHPRRRLLRLISATRRIINASRQHRGTAHRRSSANKNATLRARCTQAPRPRPHRHRPQPFCATRRIGNALKQPQDTERPRSFAYSSANLSPPALVPLVPNTPAILANTSASRATPRTQQARSNVRPFASSYTAAMRQACNVLSPRGPHLEFRSRTVRRVASPTT